MSIPVEQPRLSVVMAVYNGEDSISETVDSLLGQTFTDFELIIVDDGSTDGTGKILQRYVQRDPRVRILDIDNGGLTRALLIGCGEAKGEFIARQDCGDRSLPDRFRLQVGYLDSHPTVVAVGAGCRRVGPQGEFLGEAFRDRSPEGITEELLSRGVGLTHPASLFRADAYRMAGGYREAFRFAQDIDLWYRLALQGQLAEISDVAFELRIDVGGISATRHDRQRRLALMARQSYERLAAGESDDEILLQARTLSWMPEAEEAVGSSRNAAADAEFFIGSQLYALGDPRCRPYLYRAIRESPLRIRPWAKLALSLLKGASTRG